MIKRVAIVAEMGIGDFIFSTPFISMIHRKYPGVKIDVGVKDVLLDALSKWDIFHRVVPFMDIWNNSQRYSIIFSGRHSHPIDIQRPGNWLVPNRGPGGNIPLERVYRSNVDFLQQSGLKFEEAKDKPFWIVDKASKKQAEKILGGLKRPFVGIHNSKDKEFWFRRKWPNKYFNRLTKAVNATFIQFGSIGEDWSGERIGTIRAKTGGDLQLLAATLQMCDVFVGADTGVTVLAQALHVPTIALMGPTDVLGVVDAKVIKYCVCSYQPCLYCRGDKTAEDIMRSCKGRANTPCMQAIVPSKVISELITILRKERSFRELI